MSAFLQYWTVTEIGSAGLVVIELLYFKMYTCCNFMVHVFWVVCKFRNCRCVK